MLKKIFLSFLLSLFSSSLLNAEEIDRSGFLIGVFAGTNSLESASLVGSVLPDPDYVKSNFIPVGLRLGYQLASSDSIFGSRIYADYSYATTEDETKIYKNTQSLLSFNLDILADFNIPNTQSFIGVFAGINYGIYSVDSKQALSTQKVDIKGFGYNAGLALTFSSNHRLELFYKALPKTEYEFISNGIYSSYKMTGITGLAYQYNF
ncbi:outer membrane beta-barrel protein [uncultured Campylobacter sp.]|mgnify:CR=1 FL=1|uniref:outer membrane beta-barrel protein n=1 Tax=uncultured Campylobacter sp. TaxID=218934 RepID=UPI0026076674|nr:outer membrane beta-barrel protein [uncultured Campylobacter sp.]